MTTSLLTKEIKDLKQINKFQESALNVVIAAYWKLYYENKSFPSVDAVRRIESRKKDWVHNVTDK